jgi:hypothetical protein
MLVQDVSMIHFIEIAKACLENPGKIQPLSLESEPSSAIAFTIAIVTAAVSAKTSSSNEVSNAISACPSIEIGRFRVVHACNDKSLRNFLARGSTLELVRLLIFSGLGSPQRIWHYLSRAYRLAPLALASDEQGGALFRKPLKNPPLGTPENRGFSN